MNLYNSFKHNTIYTSSEHKNGANSAATRVWGARHDAPRGGFKEKTKVSYDGVLLDQSVPIFAMSPTSEKMPQQNYETSSG